MPDFNNDSQQNQWNNNFPNTPQQPYMQNPNNLYNTPYNNPYNNYQGNMNQQNPYAPNNMGYIPQQPLKSRSPKLIYIILIAVIIFFAVIIVLMSTSMRAMLNGGNNTTNGNEQNNIIFTESKQETTEEETTETFTEAETPPTTEQTTTTTTTEPVPETVTVTVIVEVEKEVIKEVEVPVQNNYEIYNGAYYACVSTEKDPLNIRSTPDKNGKVLGTIPKGKYIDVYMTSETGWYYTTYGGVSGYVSSDYITLILSGAFYGYNDDYNGYYDYDNSILDGDGHNGDWATIATKSDPLNLRSSPSTSSSIITSIPKGSSVYVNYEYDSTWCYITWESYTGYVMTQYLAF